MPPDASTWSSPPKPMSYAQPSPPTIQTDRSTSASASVESALPAGRRARRGSRCSSAMRARCSIDRRPRRSGRPPGAVAELVGDGAVQLAEQPPRLLGLLVEREAHAEAELGVVLEERVRPRRAAPFGVLRPRRRRQVAAVDRRAAGRVRDEQPVAEELRQEFEVGRLAAAGAGARELEQRLQHLRALDGRRLHLASVDLGKREEEIPVLALALEVVGLRQRVERLVIRILLVLRRTRLDADAAAGAVVGRNLDGHPHPRQVLRAPLLRPEAGRRPDERLRLVDLHPDRSVRADERALGAVDADRLVPDRELLGEVALLEMGRAEREGAVDGERADRQASPRPAISARSRSGGPVRRAAVAVARGERPGTSTSCSESRARSTARKLRSTISWPRLAYVFAIASLIAPMARFRGSTPRGRRSTSGGSC